MHVTVAAAVKSLLVEQMLMIAQLMARVAHVMVSVLTCMQNNAARTPDVQECEEVHMWNSYQWCLRFQEGECVAVELPVSKRYNACNSLQSFAPQRKAMGFGPKPWSHCDALDLLLAVHLRAARSFESILQSLAPLCCADATVWDSWNDKLGLDTGRPSQQKGEQRNKDTLLPCDDQG